jgi:hypothetical protein
MLILFDSGTPAPLRYALKGHVVVEAIERGWDRLLNGELIAAAEAAGFELLVTTGTGGADGGIVGLRLRLFGLSH